MHINALLGGRHSDRDGRPLFGPFVSTTARWTIGKILKQILEVLRIALHLKSTPQKAGRAHKLSQDQEREKEEGKEKQGERMMVVQGADQGRGCWWGWCRGQGDGTAPSPDPQQAKPLL